MDYIKFAGERPPGPGKILLKELSSRCLVQRDFITEIACNAGMSYDTLYSVIHNPESYAMTPFLAYQLELALNPPIFADTWMGYQAEYDLWPLRKAQWEKEQKGKILEEPKPEENKFPLTDLKGKRVRMSYNYKCANINPFDQRRLNIYTISSDLAFQVGDRLCVWLEEFCFPVSINILKIVEEENNE